MVEKVLRETEKVQGPTKLIEHEIHVKPGANPVRQAYCQMSPIVEQFARDEVKKMLETFFCFYPMTNLNSVLDKLRKAKFITKIDLKSAFTQVNLEKKSRKYSTFAVPGCALGLKGPQRYLRDW